MKVLLISPNNSHSPSFYRAVGPFSVLDKSYSDVSVTDGSEMNITWATLKRYDIVFLSKPCRYEDLNIVHLAKATGVFLWVDFDDNMLQVNEDNPSANFFNNKGVQDLIIQIISIADILTVSTEELKTVYNKYNNNIKVLHNALDESILSQKSRPLKQNNLIFYRGSNTHWVDLYKHTDSLLDLIGSSHGWNWLFLGFHPWWISSDLNDFHNIKMEKLHIPMDKSNGVYWKEYIDIMYYFSLIKQLAPSINIVPLADTHFNRSKSNISFIEGTYMGAVTIAPKYLPEFNKPGVLLYDDEQGFKDILNKAIHKKIDLKKHNSESWEYIQQNLTLKEVNKLRYEIIRSVM